MVHNQRISYETSLILLYLFGGYREVFYFRNRMMCAILYVREEVL